MADTPEEQPSPSVLGRIGSWLWARSPIHSADNAPPTSPGRPGPSPEQDPLTEDVFYPVSQQDGQPSGGDTEQDGQPSGGDTEQDGQPSGEDEWEEASSSFQTADLLTRSCTHVPGQSDRTGARDGPVQAGAQDGPVQAGAQDGPVQAGAQDGPVQAGKKLHVYLEETSLSGSAGPQVVCKYSKSLQVRPKSRSSVSLDSEKGQRYSSALVGVNLNSQSAEHPPEGDEMGRKGARRRYRKNSQGQSEDGSHREATEKSPKSNAASPAPKTSPAPSSASPARQKSHSSGPGRLNAARDDEAAGGMEGGDFYRVERKTETPESKRRSMKVSKSEVKLFTKNVPLQSAGPAGNVQVLHTTIEAQEEGPADHRLKESKKPEDKVEPAPGRLADKISLFENLKVDGARLGGALRSADGSPNSRAAGRLRAAPFERRPRRSSSSSPPRPKGTTIREHVKNFDDAAAASGPNKNISRIHHRVTASKSLETLDQPDRPDSSERAVSKAAAQTNGTGAETRTGRSKGSSPERKVEDDNETKADGSHRALCRTGARIRRPKAKDPVGPKTQQQQVHDVADGANAAHESGSSGTSPRSTNVGDSETKQDKDPSPSSRKTKQDKDPSPSSRKTKQDKDPSPSSRKTKQDKDPSPSSRKTKQDKDPSPSSRKTKQDKDPSPSSGKPIDSPSQKCTETKRDTRTEQQRVDRTAVNDPKNTDKTAPRPPRRGSGGKADSTKSQAEVTGSGPARSLSEKQNKTVAAREKKHVGNNGSVPEAPSDGPARTFIPTQEEEASATSGKIHRGTDKAGLGHDGGAAAVKRGKSMRESTANADEPRREKPTESEKIMKNDKPKCTEEGSERGPSRGAPQNPENTEEGSERGPSRGAPQNPENTEEGSERGPSRGAPQNPENTEEGSERGPSRGAPQSPENTEEGSERGPSRGAPQSPENTEEGSERGPSRGAPQSPENTEEGSERGPSRGAPQNPENTEEGSERGPSRGAPQNPENTEEGSERGPSRGAPQNPENTEEGSERGPSRGAPQSPENTEEGSERGPSRGAPQNPRNTEEGSERGPSRGAPQNPENTEEGSERGPSRGAPQNPGNTEEGSERGPSRGAPQSPENTEERSERGPSRGAPQSPENTEEGSERGPSRGAPQSPENTEEGSERGPSRGAPQDPENTEEGSERGPSRGAPQNPENTEEGSERGPSRGAPQSPENTEEGSAAGGQKARGKLPSAAKRSGGATAGSESKTGSGGAVGSHEFKKWQEKASIRDLHLGKAVVKQEGSEEPTGPPAVSEALTPPLSAGLSQTKASVHKSPALSRCSDQKPGADGLQGGPGADGLQGGPGADGLQGGLGADGLQGGPGADGLQGGPGADGLQGGPGADGLQGGPGADGLQGGPGADGLQGGPGADGLQGGPGADGLQGGPGADGLQGGPGADGLQGGPGADGLQGGPWADGLQGGLGADGLQGGPGADGLQGGPGADGLQGGPGADGLQGGPGADGLQGGSGAEKETFMGQVLKNVKAVFGREAKAETESAPVPSHAAPRGSVGAENNALSVQDNERDTPGLARPPSALTEATKMLGKEAEPKAAVTPQPQAEKHSQRPPDESAEASTAGRGALAEAKNDISQQKGSVEVASKSGEAGKAFRALNDRVGAAEVSSESSGGLIRRAGSDFEKAIMNLKHRKVAPANEQLTNGAAVAPSTPPEAEKSSNSSRTKASLAKGRSKDDWNLSAQRDAPSSWLDVDFPKRRLKVSGEAKLTSSGSESNLLDTSGDLDDRDFVEKIKKLCAPFQLPPRKHNPLRPPQPPFAMPAIKEARLEKTFDPEEFTFGLRKQSKFSLETPSVLAKLQGPEGKPGLKPARASLADRSVLLGGLERLRDKTNGKEEQEEPKDEAKDEVRVKSRLEGSCVLNSLTTSTFRSKLSQAQAESPKSAPPGSNGPERQSPRQPGPPPLSGTSTDLGTSHKEEETRRAEQLPLPPEPQTPGPQTPGPQTPGPQTPGPQTPGPQTPGPQTPGPQTPGPQTPGPQTPGPQTPGPQTPGFHRAKLPGFLQKFLPRDEAQDGPGRGPQVEAQDEPGRGPQVTEDDPAMPSNGEDLPDRGQGLQVDTEVGDKRLALEESLSAQSFPGELQVHSEVTEKTPTVSDPMKAKGRELPEPVTNHFAGISLEHKAPPSATPNQKRPIKTIRTVKGFHKRPGKMLLSEKAPFEGQIYEVHRDMEDATGLVLSPLVSVRVVRGCWILYEKPGFQGRTIALEEGSLELSNVWAEPGPDPETTSAAPLQIGSIRLAVADYCVPHIDLFTEPEGRGRVTAYHDDSLETGSYGIPLSTASIQVHSGVWLVFSDPGFQGMLSVLETGVYPFPETWGFPSPFVGSLRPLKMGGFKVENPNEVKAVVYERAGLEGPGLDIETDMFSFGDEESAGVQSVGSVVVQGGLWVGYSEPGFEGQQYILEEGQYLDCEDWGGSEILSLRPVLADFLTPHVKMFSDRDFGKLGVNIDLTVPVTDLDQTGYGPRTHCMDVLSGVWVVFEEPGFCGESYVVEKGQYGSPEDWGATRPVIASAMPVVLENFENAAKFKVQVFSEPDFRGSSLVLEDSEGSLPGGLSVASCKVLAGSWLAFEGEDFSGRMYVLDEGTYPEPRAMGCAQPDTSILSLQVVGFEFSAPSIVLFERPGLKGKRLVLSDGAVNLQLSGGGGRVQSVAVEGGVWVLYEEINFRGAQLLLRPGEVTNWRSYCPWRKIGSLRPLLQRQVHFQLRNRQSGQLLTVTGDTDDVKLLRVQEMEDTQGFDQVWFFQNGHLRCKLLEECCLCPSSSVTIAGARVGLAPALGQDTHLWSISPEGVICYSGSPGLVLEVKGGHNYDKNQMVLNTRDPNKLRQQWQVEVL